MTKFSIITIDGPAASGKSTLAFRLANALGYLYFDTGLMYRAVTWLVLNHRLLQGSSDLIHGMEIQDEAAVTRLAEERSIQVTAPSLADGRSCDVVVGGYDITWELNKPEVDANVSIVSAYAGVRSALTLQQRRIGLNGRVVMVGRDIGTVVLPEADLKIYLVASAEERARRRYHEILARAESGATPARGAQVNYQDILAKVIERDYLDSTRAIAPLKPAVDAIILDSDQLDADTVFERAYALCKC